MDNDQEWDFLLFQPSAQHTAALCLQRRSEPSLSDTESHSSHYSVGSKNMSLSEHADSSCDQSELSYDSQACTEASPASSAASNRVDMLAMDTRELPSAESQGSSSSGSCHHENGSSLDGGECAEVGSFSMPGLDNRMDVDESVGGRERRRLASRLVAWRVVPLVSESVIRTEDMDVLGMTAP